MKVILTQDVKKHGNKGDVVEVADGYARNYLLPRGLAEAATSGKVKQLKQKEKRKKRKENNKVQAAESLADKLESEKFTLKVKAGDSGRLFGSVTTKDIADKVAEAGYEIDKRKIDLDDHIKSLGMHKIDVKLYGKVFATLNIEVIAE